jgi:hypothetical protein
MVNDDLCKNLPQPLNSLLTMPNPTVLEENIRKEAAKAFADDIHDPAIKIQLLLVNKIPRQPRTTRHAPS